MERLLYLERRYREAVERLEESAGSGGLGGNSRRQVNRALRMARLYGHLGERDAMREQAAATLLERMVRDNDVYHAALGIAYAMQSRRPKAIGQVEIALQRYPPGKDALHAADTLVQAAEVYTILGEIETAIDHLDRALAISGVHSLHEIRLEPRWDPLRAHPRYRQMLERPRVTSD